MHVAVPAMTPNQAADLATHVPTTLGSILVSPETEKDEAFPQELAVPEVSLDKVRSAEFIDTCYFCCRFGCVCSLSLPAGRPGSVP